MAILNEGIRKAAMWAPIQFKRDRPNEDLRLPSVIIFKDKWTCDYHVYCERHLIENFFNQLKNFRRIATRYDKLAHVYLATVYIASICILLK